MNILFVCELNSVRSVMAEGILSKRLGHKANVESCGLTPEVPNNFMITIMKEVDVDMSGHEPRGFSDVEGVDFDRIIAFTEKAKDRAESVLGAENPEIELWNVPNPGEGSFDVRAMMNNYRAIRAHIEARIDREFA